MINENTIKKILISLVKKENYGICNIELNEYQQIIIDTIEEFKKETNYMDIYLLADPFDKTYLNFINKNIANYDQIYFKSENHINGRYLFKEYYDTKEAIIIFLKPLIKSCFSFYLYNFNLPITKIDNKLIKYFTKAILNYYYYQYIIFDNQKYNFEYEILFTYIITEETLKNKSIISENSKNYALMTIIENIFNINLNYQKQFIINNCLKYYTQNFKYKTKTYNQNNFILLYKILKFEILNNKDFINNFKFGVDFANSILHQLNDNLKLFNTKLSKIFEIQQELSEQEYKFISKIILSLLQNNLEIQWKFSIGKYNTINDIYKKHLLLNNHNNIEILNTNNEIIPVEIENFHNEGVYYDTFCSNLEKDSQYKNIFNYIKYNFKNNNKILDFIKIIEKHQDSFYKFQQFMSNI